MNLLVVFVSYFAQASTDPFVCPPYLQDVSEQGAVISWKQTGKAPAAVSLTPLPDGVTVSKNVSGARFRSVTWKDLDAHRRYRYSVTVSGKRYEGTFRTGRGPNSPFVFLAFGDTRYNVAEHMAVVDAMSLEHADLIIHTGDVVHRADERLYERFFRIEHPILASAPLYPALGNHELSRSWTRGRKLFEKYFRIENRGPCLGICYSLVHGNSMFLFLDSNVPILGGIQETWAIDRLVEASTDPSIRHVFVVLHQGPFSSGPHGANFDLADSDLFDAFQRFGVDIVFSGHDHLYERGRVGRVTYVVTAGGGAPLYPIKHVLSTTEVVESVFHYVRVRVSGPSVEVAAYRVDGSLLDWFLLGPRHDDAKGGHAVPVFPRQGNGKEPSGQTGSVPERRPDRRSGKPGVDAGGCRTTGPGGPAAFWLILVVVSMGAKQHRGRTRSQGCDRWRKKT